MYVYFFPDQTIGNINNVLGYVSPYMLATHACRHGTLINWCLIRPVELEIQHWIDISTLTRTKTQKVRRLEARNATNIQVINIATFTYFSKWVPRQYSWPAPVPVRPTTYLLIAIPSSSPSRS